MIWLIKELHIPFAFSVTLSQSYSTTNLDKEKRIELYMKCCTLQNITACTVDYAVQISTCRSLCQASSILAVMSGCLPACLSINLSVCLFSACLSLCLTAYLSLHPSEFVQASLIRLLLCISPPLCSDAVIPILYLLKEACCPCFVQLAFSTSCFTPHLFQ